MITRTLIRRIESKNKIVKVVMELVHSFHSDTAEEYRGYLDNFYDVLNKELGIK